MRLIWMKVQAHGTNPDLYRCYLLSKSDWKRIKYTDKNEPLQTWQPIEFNTCMRTSRFTMYAFFHNWYLQPCCSLIKCRNGDYKSHLTLVYVKFGRNFHFFQFTSICKQRSFNLEAWLFLNDAGLPGRLLCKPHSLCPVREVQWSLLVPGTGSDIMVCVFGAVCVWVTERLSGDMLIVNLPSLLWH